MARKTHQWSGQEGWRDAIVILLAHGSETAAGGADQARRHAAELRSRGIFADVQAAFLRDEPRPRELIARQAVPAGRDVYIVPFMAADGYSTETLIPDALGLAGTLTEQIIDGGKHRVHVCRPVGVHPALLDWSVQQVVRFANRTGPGTTDLSVLVVAHGTDRHVGNFDRAQDAVDALRQTGIATSVEVVFLDQAPRVDRWREHITSETVLAFPFLMSLGRHGHHDIPSTLGFADQVAGDALSKGKIIGPYAHDGRTIYYGPLLGACPAIPDAATAHVSAWDAPDPAFGP